MKFGVFLALGLIVMVANHCESFSTFYGQKLPFLENEVLEAMSEKILGFMEKLRKCLENEKIRGEPCFERPERPKPIEFQYNFARMYWMYSKITFELNKIEKQQFV